MPLSLRVWSMGVSPSWVGCGSADHWQRSGSRSSGDRRAVPFDETHPWPKATILPAAQFDSYGAVWPHCFPIGALAEPLAGRRLLLRRASGAAPRWEGRGTMRRLSALMCRGWLGSAVALAATVVLCQVTYPQEES